MPFEKGIGSKIYENVGRKGYELERDQLEKMRSLVDKDLKLVGKIYEGKATKKDFEKLAAVQARIAKYLDKLHAAKTDITSDGQPLQVIVPQVVAETFKINATDPETN